MSTLEATVSLLETFDKPLSEDEIVRQLTESAQRSDEGDTKSAKEVSDRMRAKYE